MTLLALIHWLLALLLAPLLLGLVNKTKAVFAGRSGPPWCQAYYDLVKLLRKGAVYSRTTGWVFRLGPALGLAAVVAALAMVPLAGARALIAFPGDFLLLAYLLGLMRFFTIAAALDTGSAFEGMGASREAQMAALAEPALFLGLAAIACQTGEISLSAMFAALSPAVWAATGPALVLVGIALLLVFLTENARIPVDDPNTHLELTMIHEVMVLDHSGPDFAFILYGAALKFWVLGALLVGVLTPIGTLDPWVREVLALGSMALVAVAVGVIESVMARLRLLRVPQMLVSASALAVLALILILR